MYIASGVYYLNPAFWFSDWQNPSQGEWIYFLRLPKLIVSQKNKLIDLFHCFSWWKLKWKHECQLPEFPREKSNHFILSIQNKFWSTLLMMWLKYLRKFQSSIWDEGRISTHFFLFKNSGGKKKKREKNTRTPKYFVEKIFYKIHTELVKSCFIKHKLIRWILYCWKKELTTNSIAIQKIILGIALSSMKAVTQRTVVSSCKILAHKQRNYPPLSFSARELFWLTNKCSICSVYKSK